MLIYRVKEVTIKTIKIFIASSAELKEDREDFRTFISVENDRLYEQGIYLKLIQWEYFLDSVSDTRLQEEYNKALRECDIAIYLFFTKVGKYTAEEFDTAYELFKTTGRPRIWTYFKDAPIQAAAINDDILSLIAFKKKLGELGHFFTSYANTHHLLHHFKSQLEKILPILLPEQPAAAEAEPSKPSTTLAPAHEFNERLTKTLMEAIQEDSPRAKKFVENAGRMTPDWEKQSRFSDPAKEILAYSFAGILGIQLRKLMAIGKERDSLLKFRKYPEHCQHTAMRTLQLLCFSLISGLWDASRNKQVQLNSSGEAACHNFFEDEFEPGIDGLLALLTALLEIYSSNGLELPIAELSGFVPGGNFIQACTTLFKIDESGDAASAADCLVAEEALTTFLAALHFLAGYKMVSIKSVAYHEARNAKPHYLYRFTSLGIDNKSNINQERLNYAEVPITTDAVFLFKDNYLKGLNLFPFVIDVSALNVEDGAKICFYASRDNSEEGLLYSLTEDNSKVRINKKSAAENISDINELWTDAAKRNEMRQGTVFAIFMEARQSVTGLNNNQS